MSLEVLKEKVRKICARMPVSGLVTGTAGNVSARDPQSGLIAIKPSGFPYDRMTTSDIVVLTPEGEFYQKTSHKPSFETPTHLEIYRRYPKINGVIHTHSPFVNTLACVIDHIPCATTPTGLRLLIKPIPVTAFINNGTQDMADVIAPLLAENVGVAIRNHGPFTVGESLQIAFDRAVALEDTSRIFYQASLLGRPTLIEKG